MRGPIWVMREQLQVIARPQEVIARRRASSRGPRGSFERPLRLQSGHRTVLPRRLALLALPLGGARERARVESLKPALLRRAPLLPGGDEEVVRWPLWGRSVPIAVGVVGEMTPSGGEMTSSGRETTSRGRLVVSQRRGMRAARLLIVTRGRARTG